MRRAEADDDELLFRVYASGRADELADVPWTDAEQELFLRHQFEAQRSHYRTQYPTSEELVVEEAAEPIGRLYLDRRDHEFCVMDIALLPDHRNRGIGGQLLVDVLADAHAQHVPVSLHVEASNPARRLYARLGFVEVERGPVYDRLEWHPEPAA